MATNALPLQWPMAQMLIASSLTKLSLLYFIEEQGDNTGVMSTDCEKSRCAQLHFMEHQKGLSV